MMLKIKLKDVLVILVFGSAFLIYYWSTFLQYHNVHENSDIKEILDKEIISLKERYEIPALGIAIVNDGEIVYQNAFGMLDVNQRIEYTINSPIRVQSISKSVTSIAIAKLVDEYNLDVNQPLGEFINLSNLNIEKSALKSVTIEELLTHTSGLTLGDIFAMYDPYAPIPTLKKSLERTIDFNSSMANKFYYSNTGYNLLEWIIEQVTHQSFEQYVKNEVLDPLNMTNSTFDFHALKNKPKLAGYSITHKPIAMYVYAEKGSGELFSTLNDMTKFINYMSTINDSDWLDLNLTFKTKMLQVNAEDIGIYNFVYDGYGYGFYIETLKENDFAIAHGGQGAGVMSHFHVLPNDQSGVVILTNSQRSWPMIAHVLSLYRRMYGFNMIKMESLIYIEATSFAIVGCLVGGLILSLKRLNEMIRHKRIVSSKRYFICSLVVVGVITWSLSQDYLLLTSVLPMSGFAILISLLLLALSYLIRPIIGRFIQR